MPQSGHRRDLELRDYLRLLRRHKGVIALTVLGVVVAALLASFLQTPVYQAEAQLLLQPRSTESLFDPEPGRRSDPARGVQTEIELLESEPVRQVVRQRLGTAPRVSGSSVGQTDVVRVRARSTKAKQAAAVANAYANAYIEFRRNQAIDDLLAAGREIQKKIDLLQREIDVFNQQIANAAASSTVLGERRDGLVAQQVVFRQQLDRLQLGATLKTGGAQLVKRASTPSSPVEPTPVRNGLVALAVGLVLGVGVAFLLDYLGDSIRDKEDLEEGASGIPSVGFIPVVRGWRKTDSPQVVSLDRPDSLAAEAYRSLRTSVQFLGLERSLRAIQVTSPGAVEGKTTTLANLGVVLARAGQRVLLVDSDLRRPRLHEFFGLTNEVGFTSILLGEVDAPEAVQSVPGTDGLGVLASGPTPPLPSELLSSLRTRELLVALRDRWDIVLVDSPPVLPLTDATVLSRWVDGILLVAKAGFTSRRALHRAVELLRRLEAPLIGAVLNGAPGEIGYGPYRYIPYAGAESNGAGKRTSPTERQARTTL